MGGLAKLIEILNKLTLSDFYLLAGVATLTIIYFPKTIPKA